MKSGDAAQWLRGLSPLPENLDSFSSTYLKCIGRNNVDSSNSYRDMHHYETRNMLLSI